tara:strand:+ start:465 stop:602 length:138 start_codon:yes stop_codon:yes gene_type:complete
MKRLLMVREGDFFNFYFLKEKVSWESDEVIEEESVAVFTVQLKWR